MNLIAPTELRNFISAIADIKRCREQLDKEENALYDSHWKLKRDFMCEFVTEGGCRCHNWADREVYGLVCCEEHAQIRERY